ncbi:MAG: VOC family protein [Burkholderiaceae bacterium]
MNLRINYVELPANDFDAVQAFYAGAFGWAFTDYGEQYRAFSDGHLEGGFTRSEKVSRVTSGAALVILYAPDLEAARDAVLRHGGRLSADIFAFPGGRRFHFLDPHGNELAIWSDGSAPA